jgi:hypothetical protein
MVFELVLGALLVGMGALAGMRRPRPPDPQTTELPALGPYRNPDQIIIAPASIEALGPWHNCPQCGAPARRCFGCGEVRTDRIEGATHRPWYIESGKPDCGAFCEHPDDFLEFTRGTSPMHLCTPQQRVRLTLWGHRCTQPGLHVHQRCQRCGWAGIALVGRMMP